MRFSVFLGIFAAVWDGLGAVYGATNNAAAYRVVDANGNIIGYTQANNVVTVGGACGHKAQLNTSWISPGSAGVNRGLVPKRREISDLEWCCEESISEESGAIGCNCNDYVVNHNSSCYPRGYGGGCGSCPGIVPRYHGCIPKPLPPPFPHNHSCECCACLHKANKTKPLLPGVYYCEDHNPSVVLGGAAVVPPAVAVASPNRRAPYKADGIYSYGYNSSVVVSPPSTAACGASPSPVSTCGASLPPVAGCDASPPVLTCNSTLPGSIVPTCDMPDADGDAAMLQEVSTCGDRGYVAARKFSHGRWYWSPAAGKWMWEQGRWVLDPSSGQYNFVVGEWQFQAYSDVTSSSPNQGQVLVF